MKTNSQALVLAVIEAPGKVHHLEQLLRKVANRKVEVFATKGHLMANPKTLDPLGIDENLKEFLRGPIDPDRVRSLESSASGRQEVWIMTDADWEGDAIALDVAEVLGRLPPDDVPREVWRIPLSSLDAESIRAGLAKRYPVDPAAAIPARTRALVDRIVGAVFSGELPSGERFSCGRVQTALLGDIAIRAGDGRGFPLGDAFLVAPSADGGDPFVARVPIRSQEDLELWKERAAMPLPMVAGCVDASGKPAKFPDGAQPWHMGDAMMAASAVVGLPIQDVASSLQRLYERGRISYPRTGSRRFSQAGASAIRQISRAAGAAKYSASSLPILGEATRDETHEALRPLEAVNVAADPTKLPPDEAVITLIARNVISVAGGGQVERAQVSGLPEWAQNLNFERASAPRAPWRDEAPKAGVLVRQLDAAILGCVLESNLGRPSTWANHATTMVTRGLIGNSMRLTEKGEAWVQGSPTALLTGTWAKEVDQVLEAVHRASLGRCEAGFSQISHGAVNGDHGVMLDLRDDVISLLGGVTAGDISPAMLAQGDTPGEDPVGEEVRIIAGALLDRLPANLRGKVAAAIQAAMIKRNAGNPEVMSQASAPVAA
jgi:DNA topoisomerase-1